MHASPLKIFCSERTNERPNDYDAFSAAAVATAALLSLHTSLGRPREKVSEKGKEDSGELLAIKRAFTFPSRKSQHILLLLLFKVWISFHYTNIELSASAKYETGRGNAGTANFIGAEHILKCLKS